MSAFTTNERKSLTDQQSAKLFLERGGKCEICMRKIRSGEVWHWDHVLALENGGTNDLDNMQLVCGNHCHKAKTKEDHAKAAKTRAVATRGIVPEAHRQKSMLSKRDGYKFNWKERRYFKVET